MVAGLALGCGESSGVDNSTKGSDTLNGSENPNDTGTEETDPTAGWKEDTENGTDTESASTGETSYEEMGICGLSGEATVTGDSFEGFEDHYLIGDEGDGSDVCRVRYEVVGVGTPEVTCDLCQWTFIIETRNPTVVADLSGGCAMSELGFDAAKIATEDGATRAVGYVTEYAGHSNVLMLLNDATGEWSPIGVASYVDETGEFFYSRSDGYCGY
jgi:hypothetical protein